MFDYHDIGRSIDTAQWKVSNSDTNLIDPVMGGHPSIFYNKMVGMEETKESVSMERGTLLHRYIEKPNEFIISEDNKPTKQIADLVEHLFDYFHKEKFKEDATFMQLLSKDIAIQMEENELYNEILTKIIGPYSSEQFQLFIRLFPFSRETVGYNKVHKLPTVLAAFNTLGTKYYQFLKEANGLIILDKATKAIINRCYDSIYNHPIASQLVLQPYLNATSELEIFWQHQVFNENIVIGRKAKIDRVIVDFDKKHLIIVDPKTTSDDVSKFNLFPYGAYYKYQLDRQISTYAEAWFEDNKIKRIDRDSWKVDGYNIVVQTTHEKAPCIVFKHPSYYYGEVKSHLLMNRIGFHIKSKIWNTTMEEQQNGFIQLIHS